MNIETSQVDFKNITQPLQRLNIVYMSLIESYVHRDYTYELARNEFIDDNGSFGFLTLQDIEPINFLSVESEFVSEWALVNEYGRLH